MSLRFIPFLRSYEEGKTGPTEDVLAWKRFSYTEKIPGVMFALAAIATFYCLLPALFSSIQELFRRFSAGGLIVVMVAAILCWIPYSFTNAFFYWLGVQVGLRRKDRNPA